MQTATFLQVSLTEDGEYIIESPTTIITGLTFNDMVEELAAISDDHSADDPMEVREWMTAVGDWEERFEELQEFDDCE